MYTIILGGPSGAGKSHVSQELSLALPQESLVLPVDNYEKMADGCVVQADGYIDWESPETRDFEALKANIEALQLIGQTSIPTDLQFEPTVPGACIAKTYVPIAAPEVLIVEGHLSLHKPAIRQLGNLAVYVDCIDTDVRINRRQHTAFDRYYDQTYLMPGEAAYVLPTRQFADIVLDTSRQSIDTIVTAIITATGLGGQRGASS